MQQNTFASKFFTSPSESLRNEVELIIPRKNKVQVREQVRPEDDIMLFVNLVNQAKRERTKAQEVKENPVKAFFSRFFE